MHSTRRHLNVLNVLVLLDLLEYCARNLRKAAHKATERTLMRTLVRCVRTTTALHVSSYEGAYPSRSSNYDKCTPRVVI